MGLALSSDTLIGELNNLTNPLVDNKILYRLQQELKNSVLFLGLWNAGNNTPDLSTLNPSEGSFMKIVNASDNSILGECKCNDWILYINHQWMIIPLTLTETVSQVLILNTPNNITVKKSDDTTDGYLSSTDWNTFNNKQQFIGNNLSFTDSVSNSSTSIMSARAIQSLVSTSGNITYRPNAIWDPLIDRPQIRDGAGIPGYNYLVLNNATVDIGSGVRSFMSGQILVYNSSTLRWE